MKTLRVPSAGLDQAERIVHRTKQMLPRLSWNGGEDPGLFGSGVTAPLKNASKSLLKLSGRHGGAKS